MDPTGPNSTPLVRVVVLNFDGGQMTLDCLDSLLATEWPEDRLEIVMVDNGSLDHVTELVHTEPRYRRIRVLEPLANLGFAGGCNLGMTLTGDHEFVALVNNDATVSPGWLRAMVARAATAPDVGAVNAKMLFADRYHGITFDVPAASHLLGDPRLLGVRVSGVRLDGERVDDRLAFDEQFHAIEPPHRDDGEEIARWSSARGALRVAADPDAPASPQRIAVRLSCLEPREVTLRSAIADVTATVGIEPRWVDVAIPPEPFDVINNVGSNLFANGFGGDRGFLEVDEGQYEEPAEVFAWCGGAVLLRRSYLDDVGLFDERFFLYYEDTDLSWRGRLRGWRYLYEPAAVVRHRHSSSSGVGSPVFRYYTERNRLLTLAKNAPARLAWRSGLGEVRRLAGVYMRHYVKRPLTLRLPVRAEVAHRRRVCTGYLRALPGMLADRWAGDRTVSRRSLMEWEVDKWPGA